jgi:hypothetical protein
MSAPRSHPTGMVNVVSTAQMQGKLEVYGFGQDARCISPGDMVIVSIDYVGENMHRQKVEFALRLRGRDMHIFAESAHNALMLWNDNKHWLDAPANGPRVDTRAMSEIRLADQIQTLNAFRAN